VAHDIQRETILHVASAGAHPGGATLGAARALAAHSGAAAAFGSTHCRPTHPGSAAPVGSTHRGSARTVGPALPGPLLAHPGHLALELGGLLRALRGLLEAALAQRLARALAALAELEAHLSHVLCTLVHRGAILRSAALRRTQPQALGAGVATQAGAALDLQLPRGAAGSLRGAGLRSRALLRAAVVQLGAQAADLLLQLLHLRAHLLELLTRLLEAR